MRTAQAEFQRVSRNRVMPIWDSIREHVTVVAYGVAWVIWNMHQMSGSLPFISQGTEVRSPDSIANCSAFEASILAELKLSQKIPISIGIYPANT